MVEFTGFLTGRAEVAFVRKQQRTGLIIFMIATLFALPNVFLIGKLVFHDDAFIYAMLAATLICVSIVLVPKGKKEHISMLPQRVYTDKCHIVCVAARHSDSRLIRDVRKVVDHGDYYELCFTFGKGSSNFICQKSLLTKGSLKEFESLFDRKIIRKHTG